MNKSLFIVHCIDTEGPLFESLEATFERLNSILDVQISPTKENLEKIQKGQLDLGGKERAAKLICAPSLLNYNQTWDEIDEMLDEMTSREYRLKFKDPAGCGWLYNWFVLDHVGYELNPRRRDIGYHNIFDHYLQFYVARGLTLDEVHWHAHPMPFSRQANHCATSYWQSPHILETLTRRIIDREWFPTCFRAGFHAERPDSNWLLEQWVPFDFSNQGQEGQDDEQRDLAAGRYGDWRRAPNDWSHYNPHHDDYQIPGNCRRTIFRCLNVGTRLRLLNQIDVDEAFRRADKGQSTIMAFTNHDFRDMRADVERVYQMILNSAQKFPEVEWRHSGAKEAAQLVLGIQPMKSSPAIDSRIRGDERSAELTIRTPIKLFGPQPYLAIKTSDRRYLTDNFDFEAPGKSWRYVFDEQTIMLGAVESIGLAVTFPCGGASVIKIQPTGKLISETFYP